MSRQWLGATSSLDLLLVPFLGATLFVRVLADDAAPPYSRQSGSLDVSGVIALLFILVAIGLVAGRRRGVVPTFLAALWVCIWTIVAVHTNGASSETLREGVREGSVIAVGAIVYNARESLTVPIAVRLVQFIGAVPALLAVYQLASHTGVDIANEIRANGTFAHPDGAAMFFAIASAASLWLYLDCGRHRFDALLVCIFSTALIATLSIDGLIALVAMMVSIGILRPGPMSAKAGPCLAAVLVVAAFLGTPLGAHRIARETSTNLASAERQEPNTSLAWRLNKWKILFPLWEASPLLGNGLGTTTTTLPIPGNRYSGKPPHNEYVRYLVETGVIGLATLLAATALLLRSLFRRRRSLSVLQPDALNPASLAIVILVGCLVNSLADNTLLASPTCYAAALIIVAVLASRLPAGSLTPPGTQQSS